MNSVFLYLLALCCGLFGARIGKRACMHVHSGTDQHKLCVQQHWCRSVDAGSSLQAALDNVETLVLRGCPQYWVGKAREEACLRLCQGRQCRRVECSRLCEGVSLAGVAYAMYALDTIGRLKEKFRVEGVTEKRMQDVSACVRSSEDPVHDVFSGVSRLKERSPQEYTSLTQSLRVIGKALMHLQDVPIMFLRGKELFGQARASKLDDEMSEEELARFAFFSAMRDALRDLDVDAERFVKDVEDVAEFVITTDVERFNLRVGGGGFNV